MEVDLGTEGPKNCDLPPHPGKILDANHIAWTNGAEQMGQGAMQVSLKQ
jgi:hypothetical protein